MFYVKVPLSQGVTLEAEVHHDNVYTRCHCCGAEMQVDLADVFADGEGDLESTELLCKDCTELLLEKVHIP